MDRPKMVCRTMEHTNSGGQLNYIFMIATQVKFHVLSCPRRLSPRFLHLNEEMPLKMTIVVVLFVLVAVTSMLTLYSCTKLTTINKQTFRAAADGAMVRNLLGVSGSKQGSHYTRTHSHYTLSGTAPR